MGKEMNPPTVDKKDYLETSSSGGNFIFGVNLFIGLLPETPDLAVCLFDTSGASAEQYSIFNPTVQVLVRGKQGKYEDAYAKANEVVDIFHNMANTEMGGTQYILIWKMTEVGHVGNDTKGRPIFSCSLRIKRTTNS